MYFSDVTIGLENLTNKSVRELYNDMENYKLLEIDTKEFLIHFFRKDIISSLFINQIISFSPKAVCDFQEHTFNYVKDYLSNLINIEGLTFSYDPNIFPFIITVSLSEMVLCHIDIFNKNLEVLEDFYFKDIIDAVTELNNEKMALEKEYEKFSRYSLDSMELLKDNKDINMLQSIDIIISSTRKKNNKYKNESQQQCMLILDRISEINMELEEYYLIENTLRKNMLSINYYQNKIVDRISRNLRYTITKN